MQRRKRRVLLICSQHLFGESLENMLRQADDVEVLGPIDRCQNHIDAQLLEMRPDVIVIVDEGENKINIAYLTATILQQFPSLPVISTGLEQTTFRIFSAHTRPARSSDFVEAILNLPPNDPWGATQPSSDPES